MNNEFTYTELAQEQWRDVDGYDGAYQVSDLGRVRSLKFGKERILKNHTLPSGYVQIGLSKNGRVNVKLIHRLVAQAFIPNDDDNKTQINHRNECKSDNKVSNLEYCTPQYNVTYNDIHKRKKNHLGDGGLTKRALANMERKRIHYEQIGELYDCDMTDKENLEVMRQYGVKCSLRTLKNFRKDLGITKYTKRS